MVKTGQASPKKVLITGATGFIGRKLASKLHAGGAEVHGTSRSSRTSDALPICWWKATFEDRSAAERILRIVKPDIIFHLSGMVSAANAQANIIPAYHSLVTSTVNILSLAADIGCERIILMGSSNEPMDSEPNSPYAAAKFTSSMYGRLFHRLYQTPVVIARPFVGYGPNQPSDKLIPYVMSQLLNGIPPKLSSGSWKTDWIYIDDMVEGIIRCADASGIEGSTIDIGSGELASVREIVEKVVGYMHPAVLPLFGELPDRFMEHTPVARVDETFTKIGWRATTNLEDGLRQTVKFYL